MKRTRLRIKNLSDTSAIGRFSSKDRELVGFDLEEVRRLQPGDRPASSSFDLLKSALYKRNFVRVKRAERIARIIFALDFTPSTNVSVSEVTRRSVMLNIVSELSEGFAEEANEVGFIVWSSAVDENLAPLSGQLRARVRIAGLSLRPTSCPPTRPGILFKHFLTIPKKPQIIFVFSDWYDTGDFREDLRQCFVSGFDIVPVVLTDSREKQMPRFLGDINIRSSESEEQCFAAGLCGVSGVEAVFLSLSLPFISIDISSPEEDWDKAFDEFFGLRERERR